jgi:hypothetical protein
MYELGKQVKQSSKFRWMPGMAWVDPHGTNPWQKRGRLLEVRNAAFGEQWVPDLEDPATIGCLLSLISQDWRPELLEKFEILSPEWVVNTILQSGV